MIFKETKLKGAFIIEPERINDKRGFFARTFSVVEFKKHGLSPKLVQCAISFNKKKGTLRGMHYQIAPHAQTKLVRCTMGSIYDVIIDLRRHSKTYCQWVSAQLSATNRKMLYIPEGFAHGFQTLENNTEVFYQMADSYYPKYERGLRWNDPLFNIFWSLKVTFISDKDQNYEDYEK